MQLYMLVPFAAMALVILVMAFALCLVRIGRIADGEFDEHCECEHESPYFAALVRGE